MAGKVKAVKEKEGVNEGDKVLTFDNNKDYVVIKLKADGKHYAEHKHFAEKLVKKKAAEYAKDVELEEVIPTTQILATKETK